MRFLEKWQMVLAGLLLFLSALSVVSPARAIEFSVAEFAGSDRCIAEANSLGIEHCVSYIRLGSSGRYNPAELPDNFHATIVIKLSEDYDTPHLAMLDGQYDRALRELGEKINADGRPVTIRLMAEANSFWNFDAAYREGQSPETFKEAYRYAIDFLRGIVREDLIRDLELNLNYVSFGYDKKRIDENDFARFNPGPGYVTLVTFSGYNRCGIDYEEIRRFDVLFTPAIAKAKQAFPDIPLGIAEIGSTPYCDVDLVGWWQDALAKAEAADLVRIGLFLNPNPDISDNDTPERWDAIYTDHLPEFQQLLGRYGAGQPVVKEGRAPTLAPANGEPRGTQLAGFDSFDSSAGKWSFPWEFWTDVRNTWGDEPIPGYGQAGLIAQGTFRQSALRSFGRFEIGPSFLVGYAQSNNCDDRYWQCNVRAELSLRAIARPFQDFGDYRRISLDAGIGHRQYTGGAPDRLDDGDTYGFVGVTFIAGGDWKD